MTVSWSFFFWRGLGINSTIPDWKQRSWSSGLRAAVSAIPPKKYKSESDVFKDVADNDGAIAIIYTKTSPKNLKVIKIN